MRQIDPDMKLVLQICAAIVVLVAFLTWLVSLA